MVMLLILIFVVPLVFNILGAIYGAWTVIRDFSQAPIPQKPANKELEKALKDF